MIECVYICTHEYIQHTYMHKLLQCINFDLFCKCHIIIATNTLLNGEIISVTTTITKRSGEINSKNIIKFHFEWLMTTTVEAAAATAVIKTINM